jgi:hypothetical protein
MQFNRHLKLEGLHAPFSPSQSSWLRYDEEKAIKVLQNKKAAEMGTRLHAWAKETIDLKIRQPRSKKTLYAYVNDAIGFNMSTEVVLFYSERFFGTADTISFRKEPQSDNRWVLRIHDLKTGERPVTMEQLEIYAALFCLEYAYDPRSILMELRVYQSDNVMVHNPTGDDIAKVMNHIIRLEKAIKNTFDEEV